MPAAKLKEFLDRNAVRYKTITHSKAFTAQEVAASAHVPGREMAKTVIVRLDGAMAMAVLPTSRRVDLDELREATGAKRVSLCNEHEFRNTFPGCEVGAMPPFGNLYGLEVYVAEDLREDEEIAFNAGSHTELIRMRYEDFERLVKPRVLSFSKV
jgi:Ala-tRNA(Pro) deacylase